MPRLVEILLFVAPFVAFATWRMLFPSPVPPPRLLIALAIFVGLLLGTLMWMRHQDTGDANRHYIPAQLQDGRVISGSVGPPR